jgi:hypothetical protein
LSSRTALVDTEGVRVRVRLGVRVGGLGVRVR